MSDSYLPGKLALLVASILTIPGAAVLAQSLRDAGTTKKLAVLVTLDSLLYDTITELKVPMIP